MIDTSPSQVATTALQSLPFGSLIGGPLKACIEAQAMAAKTSWQFIQEVGLNVNPETGEKQAVNVSFMFIKEGQITQLIIPLLTIVPIPYIAIHDIDISFKANINASSSSSQVDNSSESFEGSGSGKASAGFGPFKGSVDFKAGFSSKKDSKATKDSKYSVEYTMDIDVSAGQESMPAGLAKVLELLGNSLDVCDPKGTLEANALEFKGKVDEEVVIIVTYKDKNGLYAPDKIKFEGVESSNIIIKGSNAICKMKIAATDKAIKITADGSKKELTANLHKSA